MGVYKIKINPITSEEREKLDKQIVDEVAKFLIEVLPNTLSKEICNKIKEEIYE